MRALHDTITEQNIKMLRLEDTPLSESTPHNTENNKENKLYQNNSNYQLNNDDNDENNNFNHDKLFSIPPPPLQQKNENEQELILKISVLESFKSELQIENEKLNLKYKNKEQKVQDLFLETTNLKAELENKLNDLEILRNKNSEVEGLGSSNKVRKINNITNTCIPK